MHHFAISGVVIGTFFSFYTLDDFEYMGTWSVLILLSRTRLGDI